MFAQVISFVFGIISIGFCATATFWNQWAVSGPASQTFVDPVWTWRSLWEVCMQYTGEQLNCEKQVSIFETEGKYNKKPRCM